MILYLSMIQEFLNRKGLRTSKLNGSDHAFKTLKVGQQCCDTSEILSLASCADGDVLFQCQGSDFVLYDISLENACGIAIEACQFYDHWERDLILNVFDNPNYQQLIDLSEHVFRNPIFITNWQGKVLGYTKKYADAPIRDFWKDIVRNESLPISCLENLRRSPYHQILTCENQANLLYFEEQDYRCILGLVHSNHEIVLCFQIIEYNKPLTSTDVNLANIFLMILGKAHRENQPLYHETASYVFSQLLNGETVDQKRLHWILASLSWNVDNISFYLICFELLDGLGNGQTLLAQIERHIPGCKMVNWNDHIIMLLSEPLFQKSKAEIERINLRLNLKCGVSLPFQDWNNLKIYYEQAKTALDFASADNCSIHFCLDHAWQYLLSCFKETTFSMKLAHPAIFTLQEYDDKNKTELAATLYHYLIYERNTTLTAQKLYIHRNTLQHRMHKIHELIDVDLDDVNIRLHLIVSYQIVHAHSCNFC